MPGVRSDTLLHQAAASVDTGVQGAARRGVLGGMCRARTRRAACVPGRASAAQRVSPRSPGAQRRRRGGPARARRAVTHSPAGGARPWRGPGGPGPG
jgi:hypothetical protein